MTRLHALLALVLMIVVILPVAALSLQGQSDAGFKEL